jgi:hypothetical protein
VRRQYTVNVGPTYGHLRWLLRWYWRASTRAWGKLTWLLYEPPPRPEIPVTRANPWHYDSTTKMVKAERIVTAAEVKQARGWYVQGELVTVSEYDRADPERGCRDADR